MATQSSKTTTATQPAKQPEPWGTITFKAHPAKPLSINSADGITVTYAQNKGKEDFTTMTITAMSDPSVQCVKPRTEGNAFIANFEAANANALQIRKNLSATNSSRILIPKMWPPSAMERLSSSILSLLRTQYKRSALASNFPQQKVSSRTYYAA